MAECMQVQGAIAKELGFARKVGERRLDKAKINEKAEFTGCK
ncbi:hypothetical protein HALA3H3_900015 [Halomonas sp. A3H3]|nr:hypothetical protein HALA3H3_900015 [Halomonas sp. A3H3]